MDIEPLLQYLKIKLQQLNPDNFLILIELIKKITNNEINDDLKFSQLESSSGTILSNFLR
jgi:hypothetical protein